jgi:hypothetical protein
MEEIASLCVHRPQPLDLLVNACDTLLVVCAQVHVFLHLGV